MRSGRLGQPVCACVCACVRARAYFRRSLNSTKALSNRSNKRSAVVMLQCTNPNTLTPIHTHLFMYVCVFVCGEARRACCDPVQIPLDAVGLKRKT